MGDQLKESFRNCVIYYTSYPDILLSQLLQSCNTGNVLSSFQFLWNLVCTTCSKTEKKQKVCLFFDNKMVFISEKLVLYDLFIRVAAGSAAFLYWEARS